MQVSISQLQSSLQGKLIQPHAELDSACEVYNGMIDKHPAMIAPCVVVADVIASVNLQEKKFICIYSLWRP